MVRRYLHRHTLPALFLPHCQYAVVQTGWVEKPDAPYADGYGEAVVGMGDRCGIIAEKSGKRGGKPPSEDTIIRDCTRIEPETLWRCLGFRPAPTTPTGQGAVIQN